MGTQRRYAEWAPTRTEWALHCAKRALRWPVWWVWYRIESSRLLTPVWERRAGQDYTGWQARAVTSIPCLSSGGDLVAAGEVGTVTGYTLQRRHRRYVVAFERADYGTWLPAPEHVELIAPVIHGA